MSDNFTIASDEIAGVNYPRVKVSVGGPDNATDMTGGAGAVGAGTPRVTLASDDPAVTKLAGGLPAALATGGGLKTTVVDTSGTPLDYTVPALVQGAIAHDAAMSTTKPVAIGGLAKTALPTAVSDGDLSHVMVDKYGRVIARSVLRESLAVAAITFSSATTTALIAADASNKNDIYKLVIANTGSNALKAQLKDGTTVVDTFQVPAGETRGFCLSPDAATPQAAVNTAWNVTVSGTSPAAEVSCAYVKAGA